ncbi:branched-chain amino acid ABC transporter permease [Candidatus Uhrbacteria bacterium]|nr:branched-chain amino acid ABC transporter permease [Candidatus Uhrbacteria bacterium]
MSTAIQLTINILIPVALFSLVAAGFSIFYAVSRIQHLAIGASVSAAGYFLLLFFKLGVGLPLAVLSGIFASVITGILCNLIYERLQGRRQFSALVALIISLMLLLIAQSILLMTFGSQPKIVSLPAAQTRFEIFGASITLLQIIEIPVGFLALGALALYLKRSRLGVAIRATADNAEVAEIIGVNTKRIRYLTMLLASLITGLAGIFIALEFNLEPYASTWHAILAYGQTIVGGTGSILGVFLAGLMTYGAEHIGGYVITSTYKELYAFAIVFLFLLLRPAGIFGKKRD